MTDRRGSKAVTVLLAVGLTLLLAAGCVGYAIWWRGYQAEMASLHLLEAGEGSMLQIDSIALRVPILWEFDENFLDIAVCRYIGPDPGDAGHLVIAGHDFFSGAHFGSLDKVRPGDEVVVYDREGREFRYTVQETLLVMPDQVEELGQYQGERALTLMTCANNANSRLLVRCGSVL